MHTRIIKALVDTKGKTVGGQVVPMPAGSYHEVSGFDLDYYLGHPDVFTVYAETSGPPVYANTDKLTGGIRLSSGGVTIKRDRIASIGNVGTRILEGRMGTFDNSTVKTFRAIFEVAPGFDAVRPIFANGSTSVTYTVAGCNVRPLANLTTGFPSLSSITATAVTMPSSGIVPVAAIANTRNYLLGAWTDLSSVARDDGGSGALVCIDAYISTATTISAMGNGSTDTISTWASRANRKAVFRYNNGDCVTTPASFTDATNRIQSPIVGVQYAARGRVITVMGVGDSITDGRGTIIGEGWGVPACEAVSATTGPYFEWASCGWSGQYSDNYRNYLPDAISAGIVPDVVIFPSASPNDFSISLSTSEMKAARKGVAHLLRVARDNKIVPIIWTMLPVNPAVKDFGANDANRVAYNTEVKAWSGISVLDFSAALSGVTDGDGQVNILAGMTSDNIHPNDAGNAILAAIAADEFASLI